MLKREELAAPELNMFNKYLERLSFIAQNVTHENFVAIQKLAADILNSYTFGCLSDFEKRTLYNATSIIMSNMRKELLASKEGGYDGTKED